MVHNANHWFTSNCVTPIKSVFYTFKQMDSCLVHKYEQFVIIICIFCFSNSLLDDPDTQVTMKTLGLMRNLLSGREVLLLFDFPWGSRGTVVSLSFSSPIPPWELGRRLFFEDGHNLLYLTFTLYSFRKILRVLLRRKTNCLLQSRGKKFLGSVM